MITNDQGTTSPTRDQRFVDTILQRCANDKGIAARLRRADNPDTEYQSWEVLGAFGIDLENDSERLPYATVAAVIAKSKVTVNGTLTLGLAIASCYDEGHESSAAKTRLRRLLACNDLAEACRVLRPILTLIGSRAGQPLDFVRLLGQLRRFPFHDLAVKSQWAQEFYRQVARPTKEAEV